MQWEILDTGIGSAEKNMEIDARLLDGLGDTPILHFYEWEKDSATYGHFLKPQEFLDLEKAQKKGLTLAKRPTGGGMVFHLWDLAFSVLVPSGVSFFSLNTLENYAFVNQAVLAAVKNYWKLACHLILEDAPAMDASCSRFCMARPTKYDVIYEGKKIAGAAQRRRKQGYLHQGTIALVLPEKEYLEEILLPGSRIFEAMQTYTHPLLGKDATRKDLKDAKQTLRPLLAAALRGDYEY